VIRLSREYGIQTPYTSYLILENGQSLSAAPGRGRDTVAAGGRKAVEEKLRQFGADSPRPAAAPEAAKADAEAREEQRNLAEGFTRRDGKSAVDAANYLRRLKEADKDGEGDRRATMRRAMKRRFFEVEGLWMDEAFEAAHATTVVKFGSAAYFKLLEARPELKEALRLGSQVVVVTRPGRALVVAHAGVETLTETEIKELLN
ncbi:MAG TPA: hypothetical protein VEJ18_08545, partial [Planctomycetota bacterium]|nr:hypothetical protein [Planctomycetota bacterium]